MPVQLPPVYFPSVAVKKSTGMFHIEGNHMYLILYYEHAYIMLLS